MKVDSFYVFIDKGLFRIMSFLFKKNYYPKLDNKYSATTKWIILSVLYVAISKSDLFAYTVQIFGSLD